MKIDPLQVAGRVQEVMDLLQLTQQQLAQRLEITQPAISKYLRGRIPPPEVLWKLSELSGNTMEWFLTGKRGETALKLAESRAAYDNQQSLPDRIDRLPFYLRKPLLELIQAILQLQKSQL
jgi:transcriptional regulator with XRE-family HTH domain